MAGPQSDWALDTKRSIQSEEYGQYQAPGDAGDQGAPGAARGFTVAEVIEAFLVIATAMEANLNGPASVALRMHALADRYAQEAARAGH